MSNVFSFLKNISPTKVKRASANEYKLNINIETVSNVVSKWRANGTKGHSGRSKHVRSEDNIVILDERV